MTVDLIEAQAYSLDRADKNRLIDALLRSLDTDDEVAQAWLVEATRRAEEVRTGKAQCIPLEQVMAELEGSLNAN
jgi:putative addiction module component (TIGR02574 family)